MCVCVNHSCSHMRQLSSSRTKRLNEGPSPSFTIRGLFESLGDSCFHEKQKREEIWICVCVFVNKFFHTENNQNFQKKKAV